MTGLRHHLRLPWFALAAIVGVLSMVGEASARSTGRAADAPKSCCVVSTPSDCCCCPAKAGPLAPSAGPPRAATVAVEARLSAPVRPCECRSDEPAAPASKPESSPTEPRPERAHDEMVATAFSVRPLAPSGRFAPPPCNPPKSPLYLLTARLLI